ncbi:MAG: DNA-binding protein WhiA [Ruminococcus sp.]|nr:DNA-binding protein WhiA [Ruminococcus sp.]
MNEISFSQRVKEEIISRINSSAKADACLYGMLLCANSLSADEILLLTESQAAATFFRLNIERICGEGCVIETEAEKSDGSVIYSLSVKNDSERKKLLSCFSIGDERKRLKESYPKPSLCAYMIGGMFLSCGSVSDPNRDYRMELSMPNLELCNFLGLLLIERYSLTAKIVERKNRQVIYFKESDNIIDMITLMGATSSSFDFMNVKIYKDMRNKVNREVNCVNANIEKSVRAARRQIEDIELIEKNGGLEALSDELVQTARLRRENPDLNLSELGEIHTPPISRSGVSHRLKKISQLAQKIREEEK